MIVFSSGHGIVDNHAKSYTLPIATNEATIIAKHSMLLLKGMKIEITDYRGVRIIYLKLQDFLEILK